MDSGGIKTAADVVVIGGGIAGAATAYYLAKRNISVVLLERGSIGNDQSSRAWGFVRQQGRDPAELPLMVEANKIWQGLSKELEADIEWVQGGVLTVAHNEEQLARQQNWLSVTKGYNLDTRLLSREQVGSLLPGMAGSWLGGMYTPSDGHAEPTKVTLALARAAEALGATIYTEYPAQAVELSAGRVVGVVTAHGTIRTPVVVCAAGAWSTKIARTIGIDLPQLAIHSTAVETEPIPPLTKMAVWTEGCAFRQRPNGSIYIGGARGGFDVTLDSLRYAREFLPNFRKNWRMFQMRTSTHLLRDIANELGLPRGNGLPGFAHPGSTEPQPDMNTAWARRQNFMQLLPGLGPVRLRRVWAGWIDSLPDALPVLGETGRAEGFLLATGFSGHGFAMGPIVGRVMSELIADGQSSVDISRLSFHRFQEGTVGPPKSLV